MQAYSACTLFNTADLAPFASDPLARLNAIVNRQTSDSAKN